MSDCCIYYGYSIAVLFIHILNFFFSIDNEQISSYFTLDNTMKSMFKLSEELFGIVIKASHDWSFFCDNLFSSIIFLVECSLMYFWF